MICEGPCVFLNALSPRDRVINWRARQATLNGKEIASSARTMCGSCVILERTTASMDGQITEFIKKSKKGSQ